LMTRAKTSTMSRRRGRTMSPWRGSRAIIKSLSKQCNAANGNAQSKCKDMAAADYDAAKAKASIGSVDQTIARRDGSKM
jgi:hypothetical protein